MKKILALLMAMAFIVGTFAACTPSSTTGAAYPGTPDADMITINLGSEPPQMNSILTTDQASGNVLRQIMVGLVSYDQENNTVPGIAESWEYDEDTLTYTFYLREDAVWTNGTPVTAHDFVFAWTTLVTPETASNYAEMGYIFRNGEAIHGGTMSPDALAVEAVDDYTLVFTLEKYVPYVLDQLVFYSYYPVNEEFYNTTVQADGTVLYATDADMILTNGPFVMTEWAHEDYIMLEKSETYYNADAIMLQKAKLLMLTDANTALNMFSAGELDMYLVSNADHLDRFREEEYPIQSYNTGAVWYFMYNNDVPGFNNVKVRQALTIGVDVETFVTNVRRNGASPATGFTPPVGVAGLDNVDFRTEAGVLIERDFEAARALLEEGLAEEGIAIEDFTFSIICDDTTTSQTYAAYWQEQWRVNLGVEVTINAMPFASRIDNMNAQTYDVVLAGWAPDYNDPNTFLYMWTTGNGNNRTGYANPEYDALIVAAATETDPEARLAILIEAENIITRDVPIGPLYFDARDWVCSEKVDGIVRRSLQDLNLQWAYIV